jgi:hypothetical protein
MDNVLTAIFCTVVAFVLGLIVAQTTIPEHFHAIEWGNVAEWVAGIAAVATALIAWMALRSWRDQMRGASRHAAAAQIAEAARLTKYHFYDARNPWYDAAEFPPAYHAAQPPRSNTAEARGWAFLFERRYRLLNNQIMRLAKLRAKAGALLSEDSAEALEALARKARELHNFFQEKVAQIRAGPNIVSQWPDQQWVQRVNQSVEVNPEDHSDRYSLEFEAKFAKLMTLLEPFI